MGRYFRRSARFVVAQNCLVVITLESRATGGEARGLMQPVIGFLHDLGWETTVGILVLLIGGPIVYFQTWDSETKAEKAKRLARDAARAAGR